MKRRIPINDMTTLCASIAGLLAGASCAQAQCEVPLKVRSNDCNAGDKAGTSVGIDGDYMVMGSPHDTEKGADAGAAHVFYHNQWGVWSQQAKLVSKYTQPGDLAGWAVAISGGDIAVGMPYAYDAGLEKAGIVCLFGRFGDQWYEYDRFTANDPEDWAQFGTAVAADGGWILVGAPRGQGWAGANSGVIHFFHDDGGGNWARKSSVYQTEGAYADDFGESVAIHGTMAAAGAPGANIPGVTDCGSATTYFYTGGQWKETKTFIAPDADGDDAFGAAVAIGDGILVVGAPNDNLAGLENAGSAYVYTLSNGVPTFKQKLTNGNGKAYERLGSAVTVAGKTIFLSAANKSGMVVRFDLGKNGQWAASQYIVDPDQWWAGDFGSALANDGERLVIGDDWDDYVEFGQTNNGASYIVDIPAACPADTDGNGVLDLFDFLGFQNLFAAHDKRADLDCTKSYDLFDFLAYQNLFSTGCN